MSALAVSQTLHARVRACIRAFERGAAPPESFDALATDLARFQAEHVPGYARLCANTAARPREWKHASEPPPVPADAFRWGRVFAFLDEEAAATFHTSGTTAGARGTHRLRDVGTYDAAALAFGRTMLDPDRRVARVIVLGPSLAALPDSSLTHMCARFAGELAPNEPPERLFFLEQGALAVDALRARVDRLEGHEATLVLATSYTLVHLLDELGARRLPLPVGSRVMQTGGYKGRSRAVEPAELRRAVASAFAVDERAVVSEYGMTELSSQFYEATLRDPRAPHGVFVEPPWARVVPVDPASLAPLAPGEIGLARIEDLANVDSAFAVLTQDRVRRVEGGFELLGRAPDAPLRGCSIGAAEMLEGAGAR